MPCVPTVQTPSNKGFVGTVADYAPNMSPMIPGLVIHCVNEVERRGLTEVGIYRVNGSEKEIKDMKVYSRLQTKKIKLTNRLIYLIGTIVAWQRAAPTISSGHSRCDRHSQTVLPVSQGTAHHFYALGELCQDCRS